MGKYVTGNFCSERQAETSSVAEEREKKEL
jgi:hypothetical protein